MSTCKERVREHYKSRITDLRALLRADEKGEEDSRLGPLNEYALSFDYLPRGTFSDQKRGYFRYQISWGGPADEFRFYVDETLSSTRVEYWFLDWFDGAKVICTGNKTVQGLWDWLKGLDLNSLMEQALDTQAEQ